MLFRCTSCASSTFECSWCVQMSRCVNSRRNCPSDALVTGSAVRHVFHCYINSLQTSTQTAAVLHRCIYFSLLLPAVLRHLANAAHTKFQRIAYPQQQQNLCNSLISTFVSLAEKLLFWCRLNVTKFKKIQTQQRFPSANLFCFFNHREIVHILYNKKNRLPLPKSEYENVKYKKTIIKNNERFTHTVWTVLYGNL